MRQLVWTVGAGNPHLCIDEDLSDCGKDYQITCQVKLVTELQNELAQALDEPKEVPIRKELERASSTPSSRTWLTMWTSVSIPTDN